LFQITASKKVVFRGAHKKLKSVVRYAVAVGQLKNKGVDSYQWNAFTGPLNIVSGKWDGNSWIEEYGAGKVWMRISIK